MSKSKANLNQRAEHLLPRRSRWRFRLSPSPRLPSRTRIKSIRSRLAWHVPLNTNSTAEYGEASAGLSLRTCAPAASGPPLRRFTMERAALAGPLFSSISADTLAETQIRRPSHARHVCRGTGWPQPSGTRADGAPMAHQVTKINTRQNKVLTFGCDELVACRCAFPRATSAADTASSQCPQQCASPAAAARALGDGLYAHCWTSTGQARQLCRAALQAPARPCRPLSSSGASFCYGATIETLDASIFPPKVSKKKKEPFDLGNRHRGRTLHRKALDRDDVTGSCPGAGSSTGDG
jgi:hypothetical protein